MSQLSSKKSVLSSNMIKFTALKEKLYHVISIDSTHTKLSIIFRHLILIPIENGYVIIIQFFYKLEVRALFIYNYQLNTMMMWD